jgi:hypothetical protein
MSEGIKQPQSTEGSLGVIALVLVGLGWVVFAAFWAAPGVLIIDGFVYQAMIDSFARQGSFFVTNGIDEYGDGPLWIALMRNVGGQLAPQYPGGWGVIAAPAYLAGGIRGVIVLNAVASALTLPLIWLAARALFSDHRLATTAALIYGLATFAIDYAFGFWPHGVTIFLVTAAIAAVATGWRGTPAAEMRGALIAGLVLGIGVNIRVDALFAAAPICVWLLGVGRRPYGSLGLLLVGLVPGLAVATAINLMKFGIPSPLTYGLSGGATSLGYYAQLAPLMAVGMLTALALGLARVRAALYHPLGLTLAMTGVFMLLLVVPGLREILLKIAGGAWVLVVDFQAHATPAHGMTVLEDGTFLMHGVVKKALLQSLPYAAVILILAPKLWRGPDRAAVTFCILIIGLGILPYAFGTWHGGASTNMRYFLNFVPVLAILTAAALREISVLARDQSAYAMIAILAVGAGSLAYGVWRGYSLDFTFQQTLSNAVVFGITVLSVMTLVTRGRVRGDIATTLRGLVILSLMAAFFSAWYFDFRITQTKRALTVEMTELSRDLPENALVVTYFPVFAGFRLNRPPALTAIGNIFSTEIDATLSALVSRALADGRPVFAQSRVLAEQMVAKGLTEGLTPRYGIDKDREFYELAPPNNTGVVQQ